MRASDADKDETVEQTLRARLAEAEELLQAIRQGEVDALVVEGASGNQVFTLHSADEPYRDLVEQMQEGAVVLTTLGDILYANARFAAMVGESLQFVVGGRFERFVDPADRRGFATLLGSGSGRCRGRLLGSDSGAFEVGLSITATVSPHGDRLNLIVTDLTQILEASSNLERAERASRTKDEFLAMLAHELRTPVGAISNAVHVLKSTDVEGQPATAAHGVIARQVGHISHLITDLLDVERVVSGKIRLNRQPLDLADAVRRAVASVTDDAQLDRHVDIQTEPLWIDGDAVRIEQVLTNLVTNAIKYSPAGGEIRVALRADGDDAVVSVEDTGCGIPAELMPFIFDLYVQSDRTIDRAQGGLGIGLTLVRRLVELHGGTIEAASDGEALGSKFTVRLRQIPAVAIVAGVSLPLERRKKARRVLLIEDSADAREMVRMVLELAGHEVHEAADGVRGLELLKTVRPDVGIIDIRLPDMNGYQIARRIREDAHGRDMLLVALTGYGETADAHPSSERVFDCHLVKPVNPEQLVRLLNDGA